MANRGRNERGLGVAFKLLSSWLIVFILLFLVYEGTTYGWDRFYDINYIMIVIISIFIVSSYYWLKARYCIRPRPRGRGRLRERFK